jgi:hypothetical protein
MKKGISSSEHVVALEAQAIRNSTHGTCSGAKIVPGGQKAVTTSLNVNKFNSTANDLGGTTTYLQASLKEVEAGECFNSGWLQIFNIMAQGILCML